MLAGIRWPHRFDRGRCDAEIAESQCVGAHHVILLHQFDLVPGYGSTRQGRHQSRQRFPSEVWNRHQQSLAFNPCEHQLHELLEV